MAARILGRAFCRPVLRGEMIAGGGGSGSGAARQVGPVCSGMRLGGLSWRNAPRIPVRICPEKLPSSSTLRLLTTTTSLRSPEVEPPKKPVIHEDIYTLPNLLTVARIVSTPVIGYLVVNESYAAAAGLFFVSGLTDLVDGYIARRYHMQTVLGTILDPFADKLLMTVMTTTLAYQGLIPIWLAVIILGRDVGLSISALYYRWISLPPPKTMARYWDFSLPSAEVRPTMISKVNTALQIGLLGACTIHPVIGPSIDLYISGFQYLVATTTVWSGLSYVFTNDAVKILKQPTEGKDQAKP